MTLLFQGPDLSAEERKWRQRSELWLGFAALFVLPLLGPFAWYRARRVLQKIDLGLLPESERPLALMARVLAQAATLMFGANALWESFLTWLEFS